MTLQDKAATDAAETTDTTGSTDTGSADKAASKPAETSKEPAAKAPDKAVTEKPADKGPDAKGRNATSASIFDDDEDEGDDTPAEGEAKAAKEKPADDEGDDATDDAEKPKTGPKYDFVPDDWRERMAGEDDKFLRELKRYSSFGNWVNAQRSLRQKMSSGELKKAETWDDTWDDAKKAGWRKEHGIPEKVDGYQLPQVEGYQWSDNDKAAAAPLLQELHAANATPQIVEKMLGFYANSLAAAKEERVATDRQQKMETEDHLRVEWGADYRPNVKIMKRALQDEDVLPGGVGEAIIEARLPDGRRLINHTGMISFLANLARDAYGEGALLPKSEERAIDSRQAEIEKVMSEDMNRYYREKNAKGQTLEQEYREILAKRERGGRKAA